jgi:hypothetical protein
LGEFRSEALVYDRIILQPLWRSANLNGILRFGLSLNSILTFNGFKGQCAETMLSSATNSTSEISNKRAANAELLVHNPESRFGLK